MRASASGELVKDEVGQATLRRCGRLLEPRRRSAASGLPRAGLVAVSLAVAVVLIAAQPLRAATPPGPDPHPSATQPAGAPTPDPSPRGAPTDEAFTPAPSAPSAPSTTYEPVTTPSSGQPSAQRPMSAKQRQPSEPSTGTRPTGRAQPTRMTAPVVVAAASGARNGKQSLRVATAPIAAEVSVVRTTPDPMVLAALALLTLALSSAGLLLVLERSHGAGVHA
jgi:hypothetical protein